MVGREYVAFESNSSQSVLKRLLVAGHADNGNSLLSYQPVITDGSPVADGTVGVGMEHDVPRCALPALAACSRRQGNARTGRLAAGPQEFGSS